METRDNSDRICIDCKRVRVRGDGTNYTAFIAVELCEKHARKIEGWENLVGLRCDDASDEEIIKFLDEFIAEGIEADMLAKGFKKEGDE